MIRIHLALALLLICLPVAQPAAQEAASKINLNTATTAELETLPGIGRVLAGRIVAHRKAHGPFRRIEDVIIVRGMSAARFRRIARLIHI